MFPITVSPPIRQTENVTFYFLSRNRCSEVPDNACNVTVRLRVSPNKPSIFSTNLEPTLSRFHNSLPQQPWSTLHLELKRLRGSNVPEVKNSHQIK